MSFESLLVAAQAGGEWALAELYAQYQPVVLRYLRGRASDHADDLASETWIAAARGLRGFTGDANDFRAWLFTIARHRLIDARRKNAHSPDTLLSDEMVAAVAARAPSPEDLAVLRDEGDAAVRRIVALLPADQADVILLRFVADLSVEQIAAILDKKPGTVRVLQNRGLKRLSERLSRKV